MTSSPMRPGATVEEELAYYKSQYAQLELDLADFQTSSKELEEQLERDIDAAEKKERKLRETVERVQYEVEEWKKKHAQAKMEANAAQGALQKEVTGLREKVRELQMRLRDVEVVNDDFEKKEREMGMSLEEMEGKYGVAIERGVLLEEEVRVGEQEREGLRIECQRLREELGDLRVESEIRGEKLRKAEELVERLRSGRKLSPLAVENLRIGSPAGSEISGMTPSSPSASTPPPKSDSMSDAATPPSPPLSDAAPGPNNSADPKTPMPTQRRSLLPIDATTPRPSLRAPSGHTRTTSIASSTTNKSTSMQPPASRQPLKSRTSTLPQGSSLPRSDSLYQIKALRGRMQKIEARVHSARSKLPTSYTSNRTPTGSPRTNGEVLPASVTMRRSIKRPSAANSLASGLDGAASESNIGSGDDAPRRSGRESAVSRSGRESAMGGKRLSFGIPRPTSSAAGNRPPSALDGRPPSAMERGRPPSSASNRPPSRGNPAARPASRTSGIGLPRPASRTSGVGLPAPASSRPRSSVGGANYATVHGTSRSLHRPSASVSELRGAVNDEGRDEVFSPPRKGESGDGLVLARGSTGLGGGKTLRRTSTDSGSREKGDGGGGGGGGEMRPPSSRGARGRKMSDVGETY